MVKQFIFLSIVIMVFSVETSLSQPTQYYSQRDLEGTWIEETEGGTAEIIVNSHGKIVDAVINVINPEDIHTHHVSGDLYLTDLQSGAVVMRFVFVATINQSTIIGFWDLHSSRLTRTENTLWLECKGTFKGYTPKEDCPNHELLEDPVYFKLYKESQ